MSQRYEGRNVEEALQSAAEALGVERWQLTYHVLLEKRGFLGGVKRIVIEADVNHEAAAPSAPTPAASPAPVAPAPSAPATETRMPPREARGGRGVRGGGGGGGRNARSGRGGGGGRSDDRGGRGRGRGRGRGDSDLRVGDFETFILDVPEQGPESDQARTVREWCEDVIALSRLDLIVRTHENDTQIHLKLYGADARRMVEEHGELLDAVQVLANKALVGRKVEKEIELDCEEFKDRRIEDLGQRAREAADRVRKHGREELLPAMTPIERRIVHLALQEDAEVTTESRGEGFYKRVAIILRPAGESLPEAQPAPEA
ncbi:MAG TPA: R3H domain-containing nucleic acid-binding protein [Thermoanaerobaculia bacterium]|nr:R3H domain-containing nucleic acid-binding protein [Thermoanaerobaculia bacterium]